MLAEILIIVGLVTLNGYFAMSELAIVSSQRARLMQMSKATAGSKSARTALKLADEPNLFLPVVQIGISLVGVLAGAYSGSTLALRLASSLDTVPLLAPYSGQIAFAIVVVSITMLQLILGELVPKRLGLANPERIALLVAIPMDALSRATYPAVWVLSKVTDTILRLMGQSISGRTGVTEEEVKIMIAEGTATGVFVPEEKRMIDGVLGLADRNLRSIMTPRTNVLWLDPDDDPISIIKCIHSCGHSRFLVSRGDIDEVIGVVQAKDLLDRHLHGHQLDIMEVVKKPLIVHDATPVLRLLEMFRKSPLHLAVVVDEYGSVEGIVTVTDILEAIAGNFPSLPGTSTNNLVQRDDGSWLADGLIPIREIEALTGHSNMQESTNFHTLAGFVLNTLGRVPKAAEHITWHGWRFEVVDMDGHRIDKVLIVPPPSDDP